MDSETLYLLGLTAQPKTAAKATLLANQTSYTTGTAIQFNSTSANLGFSNGPTVSSGQLTPGVAGIYTVMLGVNMGWSGGTTTNITFNLNAHIGAVDYQIGQVLADLSGLGTSAFAMTVCGVANLGVSDYVWASINFASLTGVTLNAVPQTYISCVKS